MIHYTKPILLAYSLLFTFLCALRAQPPATMKAISNPDADPVEQCLWYNQQKTAKIQLYKLPDGLLYGKIVWLQTPLDKGKPKTDKNNPEINNQNNPLLGLIIVNKLHKSGDNTYEDGTVYDPKNGKTYSCKITYEGNKIELRGYIGFSLFGRTDIWTRAD